MKFYFKRNIDSAISKPKLYSYETFIVGIVSLLFYFTSDSQKITSQSKLFIGIFMGLCALTSAISLYKEIKEDSSCNIYDLLRCIISALFCIMSFTCIDIIFK